MLFFEERYSYIKNYKNLLFCATMSMSTHTSFLERHCRVCCKVLGKQNHRCSQHESLLRGLGVDVSSDKTEVYQGFFCNSCYLAAKKCSNQSSQTPSRLIEWLPHNDIHCSICDVRCKGGRPKKCSSRRPSLISTHIKSVALPVPSFTLAQVSDENYKDEVTCSCCKGAIQTHVEILPCKSLYCCNCALSLTTSSVLVIHLCISPLTVPSLSHLTSLRRLLTA